MLATAGFGYEFLHNHVKHSSCGKCQHVGERTLATNMAFLLQKIHADGDSAPKRDERPQFMNFIR